ncbi:MAG: hypothetical protein ONB51_18675 [candidate division KSB1 bacterium]|nr:hypothetical protein [candidate division KSB1 bacterium]MDZ7411251.1 hypothetical protein [candidate division KSB1 bacterium]
MRGGYSQGELVEFINLVQKISLSYLKYQEVIGKHIRWERRRKSGELDDLAIDCVAGLFMRNENNEFVQLRRYFGPYLDAQENPNDVELLIMLRRLVIKKTKQELSRIFKERDPEGAKIIRNIRVAVKNASDLGTFREMGREYIFLKRARSGRHAASATSISAGEAQAEPVATVANFTKEDLQYLRKAKPSIPEKALKNQYLDLYTPKDHVSTTIRKMLSVVTTDERYQNFLPTDVVARLIRHTNLEVVRNRLIAQIDDLSPLDYVRLKEIEQAKQKVLQRVRHKIQNQYVASAKISEEKGEIYYRTLADVLEDITHSKKIESYFRHLRKYMPDLTQRRYRQEERTIFEYLGKLTKKWFREYLKELL